MSKQEILENILVVFVAIFQELEEASEERVRLIAKFSQNKFEKVNRLIELHQEWLARVDRFDAMLIKTRQQFNEESYLKRSFSKIYFNKKHR